MKKKTQILLSLTLPLLAVLLLTGILRPSSVQAAANATLTVMNTANSGADSLRELISIADPGDTINFDESISGGTITLATELVITKNLSIRGNVPITISGDDSTRVFYIETAVVSLDHLTIANGSDELSGGGIYMESAVVTLTNSSVISNVVAGFGGGIENFNGILTIDNSYINNNSAFSGGGGIDSWSGALLIMTNSFVQDNYSNDVAGGIWSDEEGMLILTNTVVSGNTAIGPGGGILSDYETIINGGIFEHNSSEVSGGAIHYGFGGGMLLLTSARTSHNADEGCLVACVTAVLSPSLTLNNVDIISNTAFIGGGLYNEQSAVVNGGIFKNNHASVGGGGIFNGGIFGGGEPIPTGKSPYAMNKWWIGNGTSISNEGCAVACITAVLSPTIILNNVDIVNNMADIGGGSSNVDGIMMINNSTYISNTAGFAGGGAESSFGIITIADNSIFRNNRSNSFGGGLAVQVSLVTITDSDLSSNTAGLGGAVYGRGSSDITLTNSIVDGNSATFSGGGIYVINETKLDVVETAVINNDTITIGSPTTRLAVAARSGGGIYVSTSSDLTVLRSIIENNSAIENGGGIYGCINSTIIISESMVSNNSATLSGGGLYVIDGTSLNVAETAVVSNTAETTRGGGIYIRDSSQAQLRNSTISGNQALGLGDAIPDGGNGGGIYIGAVLPNIITVTHSSIVNNYAAGEGGGMDFNRGNPGDILTFQNSILAGNSAGGTHQNCYDYNTFPNYTFTSDAYNIFSGAIGDDCPVGATDLSLTALGLTIADVILPLADNGGNTLTHALSPSSIAFDIGDGTNCPSTDQRGIARPQGVTCDSGAYEATAYQLVVDVIGSGVVSSTISGIGCGADCAETYIDGTVVTLTAAPAIGYSFIGWNGGCSGTGDCVVTIDDAKYVTATFSMYTVFLPIIIAPQGEPDLVVESINITAVSLEVVIKNVGTGVTDSGAWGGFWVDLYINPTEIPTMNQTWKTIGGEGMVWAVRTSLLPGETLTLTLDGLYYDANESLFNGTIPAGAIVYAQVDAVGEPSFGAVLEADESNNIMGPIVTPIETTPSVTLPVVIEPERDGLMAKRP